MEIHWIPQDVKFAEGETSAASKGSLNTYAARTTDGGTLMVVISVGSKTSPLHTIFLVPHGIFYVYLSLLR